ncbi:MAG: YCF48-related protein [Bacteroidota bacterium]
MGVILLISSCRIDEVELPITELNSPTGNRIYQVYFEDLDTGYLVSGDRFFEGNLWRTTDRGENWTSIVSADRELRSLYILPTGEAFLSGWEGYFYTAPDATGPWTFFAQTDNSPMVATAFSSPENGVAVGGVALKNGRIWYFNNDTFRTESQDIFDDHEFSDVCFSDDQTVHAVGFGIVIRSDDAGATWTPLPTQGDFFHAIHFPDAQTGYIVGVYGDILKTDDGGQSWNRIRNNSNLFGSSNNFRDVYFVSATLGYICGDNGLLWKTTDGGDSWVSIDGLPDEDFRSVYKIQDQVFVAGDNGNLYRLTD